MKNNNYKKYNITNNIIRKYKRNFPNAKVYTKKLSKKHLYDLIDNHEDYPIIEYSEEFYELNLYDSNWIDIEGMGYGWIWSIYPQKLWREKIGEACRSYIKNIKIIKNEKIIICEQDDEIFITLPRRLVTNSDFHIYLGKKIVYNNIRRVGYFYF